MGTPIAYRVEPHPSSISERQCTLSAAGRIMAGLREREHESFEVVPAGCTFRDCSA